MHVFQCTHEKKPTLCQFWPETGLNCRLTSKVKQANWGHRGTPRTSLTKLVLSLSPPSRRAWCLKSCVWGQPLHNIHCHKAKQPSWVILYALAFLFYLVVIKRIVPHSNIHFWALLLTVGNMSTQNLSDLSHATLPQVGLSMGNVTHMI